MSNVILPEDQIVYNSRAFQANFLEYSELQPALYLTRLLNYLLKSFVTKDNDYSARLYGCDPFISQIGMGVNGNYIKFIVSPGVLILDSTLIEIPSSFSLDVNTANFIDYDEMIIMAGFRYGTSVEVPTVKCAITGINKKPEAIKAKFQVIMRKSSTNEISTSLSQLLTSQNVSRIVLGRFKIVRVSDLKLLLSETEISKTLLNAPNNKIIRIYHPYGVSSISLYTDLIKSLVTPPNTIILPTNRFYNNIVQTKTNQSYLNYYKLHSSVKLYSPFMMNTVEYSIAKPLVMNIHIQDKLHSYTENYMTSNRFNIEDLIRYSPTFDRNITHLM